MHSWIIKEMRISHWEVTDFFLSLNFQGSETFKTSTEEVSVQQLSFANEAKYGLHVSSHKRPPHHLPWAHL